MNILQGISFPSDTIDFYPTYIHYKFMSRFEREFRESRQFVMSAGVIGTIVNIKRGIFFMQCIFFSYFMIFQACYLYMTIT